MKRILALAGLISTLAFASHHRHEDSRHHRRHQDEYDELRSMLGREHEGGRGRKGCHKGGFMEHEEHDRSGVKRLDVRVNEGLIKELIDDFKNYGVEWWEGTEVEREDLMLALKDAWMNTAGRLIMNFGKTVVPVAEHLADIMKYMQVNPMCKQECAINCLSPKHRDTMYFEKTCLASCGCHFKIGEIGHEKLDAHKSQLKESATELKDFVSDVVKENYKTIKPEIDAYTKAEKKYCREFAELLRKHATKTFGCDEECLDNCLEKPSLVNFWEIPACVKSCHCTMGRIVDIEKGGKMNLPHLRKEADEDTWRTFKKLGAHFIADLE